MPSDSEWYAPVVDVLERLRLPWALAGALAANRYRAVPRATLDADLYTNWHASLVPSLEDAGYTVRQVVDPDVGTPHLLIVKHGQDRIDLLLPTVEYQEVALSRAQDGNVLTVEDVIIHKLLAWRPRDRDDVRSILDAGHNLDTAYIERWADAWEVLDLWRDVVPD